MYWINCIWKQAGWKIKPHHNATYMEKLTARIGYADHNYSAVVE